MPTRAHGSRSTSELRTSASRSASREEGPRAVRFLGRATPCTSRRRIRLDPIELLGRQDDARIADLVPIRYGRMLVSPFTFYRGAALIMAADLAATPRSGFLAQCCGDAHLSNFGMYASPERAARLRHQRLRRDAPRPVGMGRQAARRQHARSPPATTASRSKRRSRRPRDGSRVPRPNGANLRRCATLDVWYTTLRDRQAAAGDPLAGDTRACASDSTTARARHWRGTACRHSRS